MKRVNLGVSALEPLAANRKQPACRIKVDIGEFCRKRLVVLHILQAQLMAEKARDLVSVDAMAFK